MSLIKPIKLGSLVLPNNLIQAPLAGVSCAPFRVLATHYGNPAFCCTEMISAKDLIYKKTPQKRYVYKAPKEKLLCYQLSGDNEEELKHASEIVIQHGADLIDLNCGCPKTKIRAKNCGSKHLENPIQLEKLLFAIKSNTDIPVSMKIRIPVKHSDNTQDILHAAENANIDFITVHGRSWQDDYTREVNLEKIAYIVEQCKLPVIANGDAHDSQSVKTILEKTQCAGVMIARASVGQPWLFKQIQDELSGKSFTSPTLNDIGNMFIFHIDGLIQLLAHEKSALLQSRKFAKYYARPLKNKNDLCSAINKCDDFSTFKKIIAQYFHD